MRGPTWNRAQLLELEDGLKKRVSFAELSERMGRSIVALKLIAYRRLHFSPECLDCGTLIIGRKGARVRCRTCSKRRTDLQKAEYQQSPKFKKYLRTKRDRDRFNGTREQAIQRDGYKCVQCGMTRAEHQLKFGCDITLDHKDGNGRNTKEANNNMRNLQTLCLPCHGKKDVVRRRKDWSMCAAVLKKFWKENPNFKHKPRLRFTCKKCRKKIKNQTPERYDWKGNYCDVCY